MADFGEVPYLSAAVQVIPVLAIVIVADDFMRRDVADPVHRIYASTAVAVGLVWGIIGEIAGLQALLTGPTRQTIPIVSGALMALGATALGPRLVELNFPRYPDVARRVTQRLLPLTIGAVGLVVSTWHAPLAFRVFVYFVLALSLFMHIVSLWTQPPRDRAAVRPSVRASLGGGDGGSTGSAVAQQTTPQRSARWWVVASVAGIAVAVALRCRRRD